MKFVATSIVALFASVAMANTAAPTAPAADAKAPTAKDAKAAPTAKTAATKEDCTKMTGEAKTKCEAAAKTTTHH